MNRKLTVVMISFALLLGADLAHATRIPGDKGLTSPAETGTATAPYQQSGTITKVDLGSQLIVIGGTSYLFSSTQVKLHNPNSSVSSAMQLKPGMKIGFTAKPGSPGNKAQITNVWLLDK